MAVGMIQAKPQVQVYVERKPMVSILGLALLSEDDEVLKVEYYSQIYPQFSDTICKASKRW